MKIKYESMNKLYSHNELGLGTLPDGRKCRLIQTDYGVLMQIYNEDNKNEWKTYSLSYMELSRVFVDEIVKSEVDDDV